MTRRLRATWVPSHTRAYRRSGGPWDVPVLDTLMSNSGPIVVGADRYAPPEVEDLVAKVAGGLAARGVKRGQAVAWQLPNGLAVSVLFRACWRLGAVAAPLLFSFGPRERAAALEQVDPAAVLELDPDEVKDALGVLAVLGGAPVHPGSASVAPSDIAVALFTSGSTGVPKAVLHSHRGLSWKAILMARVHGIGATDAVLMPAPQAHVSGLLNGVLLPAASGMTSVLVSRFDPPDALAQVARERISFMAGPPTFFVAMTQLINSGERTDVSSVRLISSGGASVTPAFIEETSTTFNCRVKRTYGSTEAPTVTTSSNDDSFEAARDTDGRAVGEVEIRIVDPGNGRTRGSGAEGEIWVRGPELFCGYARGEQNEQVVERGWFRTGDLGTLDDGGYLRIVGRLTDVIIRGGENIAAAEVEGELESHPRVRQAVAVGYPDSLMGERVCAFVVADAPFDLEACRAWFVARQVAKFKTPERIVQLDEMPLLGTGKVNRAALKALAKQG